MTLYLVRHAKAGRRDGFDDDDRLRPLSAAGRRQADAIAECLAPLAPTALVSSPFLRCRQTLQPLSQRLRLPVVNDDRLRETSSLMASLEVLDDAPDGAVLCSHGDVIPDVLEALVRRGAEVTTEPIWRKGVVWELESDGQRIASVGVIHSPSRA